MLKVKTKQNNPIFWIFVLVMLVITLFPVYWILVTSLKNPLEVVLPNPTLVPKAPTLQNYVAVLQSGFLRNMLNSLFVSVGATTLSLVLSFTAAYALSRFKFPLAFNLIFMIWISCW